MNRHFLVVLGVSLAGGAAQAAPDWTEPQTVLQTLKASEREARAAYEFRHAPDGVSVAAVRKRLYNAAERLVQADRENPHTRLDDWEIAANPYRRPPGDNGAVDSKEAQSTKDSLAITFFDAADDFYGEVYEEGGGGEWRTKIMPAFEVQNGDVRVLDQHMERILQRVDDDGTGTLNDYKLSRLSGEIAAYMSENYRGESARSARLSPLAWAKIEKTIRAAVQAETVAR